MREATLANPGVGQLRVFVAISPFSGRQRAIEMRFHMIPLRVVISVMLMFLVSSAHADTSQDAAIVVAANHSKKGDALRDQGRLSDAEREYDLALASYADATNVHRSRGLVRYQLKNYQGAIEDFDLYLSKVPDDARILLMRGLSKSFLKPQDVAGACADLLVVKKHLAKAGIDMDKYCRGQDGWVGN